MTNDLTKANINLYAVLRNLEDLCEMDKDTKNLIAGKDITLQLTVKDGPEALISFKDGKCTFKKGTGKCNIKLYFKSPEHFNQMIDGKANPIPLKGFTNISFLKNEFTKLTDKLSYYLKPSDELLKNPEYMKINTFLTAYTAFFALAEIGNTDKIGKLNASRIPDGTISISVLNNGPAIKIIVKDGHLEAEKGKAEKPRATMTFANSEIANAILNGKMDSYTCIGNGTFEVRGYVPMLDNMNKLLSQVPAYLK
jgi:putative sterol carrier protein